MSVASERSLVLAGNDLRRIATDLSSRFPFFLSASASAPSSSFSSTSSFSSSRICSPRMLRNSLRLPSYILGCRLGSLPVSVHLPQLYQCIVLIKLYFSFTLIPLQHWMATSWRQTSLFRRDMRSDPSRIILRYRSRTYSLAYT